MKLPLPKPPLVRGRDGLARWMATVAFTAGMVCLTMHHGFGF